MAFFFSQDARRRVDAGKFSVSVVYIRCHYMGAREVGREP